MAALAFRQELDQIRCSEPDCDADAEGVQLESPCHPDIAMWAYYRHGELTLTCARCGRHVTSIAVAG
jgi:hypothetical protein